MTPRLVILGAGLGLCVVAGFAAREAYQRRAVDSARKNAAALAIKTESHAAKAEVYDAQSRSIDPELASLRAEVARLRKAAGLNSGSTGTAADTPQLVSPSVDLAPLVSSQDDLIHAQDRKIEASEHAGSEWKAVAMTAREQADALRKSIDSAPRHRLWSAGIVIGASAWGDSAKGVYLERDFSVVRAGVDLTRNTYAQARLGWEVRLRAGVTF